MLQKTLAIAKRLLVGYGFLLSLVLVGLTLGLPFVLTVVIGVSLISPDGLSLPRNTAQAVSVLSVGITLAVGLRWLCFPSRRLDTALAGLRSKLLHSNNWLLLRFVGILVAFPLFAFILSPCAMAWLVLEEGLYRLRLAGELFGHVYVIVAFFTGLIWLAVIVGRLPPSPGVVGRVLLRCRMTFIDWVLEPYNPQAARREREKVTSTR